MANTIQYYFLEMANKKTPQVPPHVSRDCIYFNKTRAELCGNVYNVAKYREVMELIHDADTISQINSIPFNSVCAIEKKVIPEVNGGVQIIINTNGGIKHIVVQKKYQHICYNYFNLRHFDVFIKINLKKWLNEQPWFLPRTLTIKFIMSKLFESTFCDNMHKHFIQSANDFT
jgi:hypothetical protein